MSAPAFPKGPWTRGEPPYHCQIFAADGYSVADASDVAALHRDFYAGEMGEGHWATTPGSHIERTDEQNEATARLLVVAPDLFDFVLQVAKLNPVFVKGYEKQRIADARALVARVLSEARS